METPIYRTLQGSMASLHQAVRLQLCKTQLIQALFAELDRTVGNYGKHEEHVGNLAEYVDKVGKLVAKSWRLVAKLLFLGSTYVFSVSFL